MSRWDDKGIIYEVAVSDDKSYVSYEERKSPGKLPPEFGLQIGGTQDNMDPELSKRLKELQDNKDGEGKRLEKIAALWSFDDDAPGPAGTSSTQVSRWIFREWDVSPLFKEAFGENWPLRVYSYKVWNRMIELLEKREDHDPAMVELSLRYEWQGRQIAVYFDKVKVTDLPTDFLLENVDIESTAK